MKIKYENPARKDKSSEKFASLKNFPRRLGANGIFKFSIFSCFSLFEYLKNIFLLINFWIFHSTVYY